MDAKLWIATCRSIKDRIYQRSENLRKTYRELDAAGLGSIPLEVFVQAMRRSFMLNQLEQDCLRVMTVDADFHRDGVIDFREFCEMLKTHDRNQGDPVITESERKRFQTKGLIDGHVQKMMKSIDHPIRIVHGVPKNELGTLTIECPFGVLGDSERMDAVIQTYLDRKMDGLKHAFEECDRNHDGFLTREEFREAMHALDRYIFDDEVTSLIHTLDRKKRGLIAIADFLSTGLGREYLKKKAHRTNAAYDNPFIWFDQQDASGRAIPCPPQTARAASSIRNPSGGPPQQHHHDQHGSASGSPKRPRALRKPPQATRASEMRMQATRSLFAASSAPSVPSGLLSPRGGGGVVQPHADDTHPQPHHGYYGIPAAPPRLATTADAAVGLPKVSNGVAESAVVPMAMAAPQVQSSPRLPVIRAAR